MIKMIIGVYLLIITVASIYIVGNPNDTGKAEEEGQD